MMPKYISLMFVAAVAVFGLSAQCLGAEYYVTESESGIIAITDHEPEEGAAILKGPFETRDAAEEALTDEEKEQLGTRGKGKGQGKGQGRGQWKNRPERGSHEG